MLELSKVLGRYCPESGVALRDTVEFEEKHWMVSQGVWVHDYDPDYRKDSDKASGVMGGWDSYVDCRMFSYRCPIWAILLKALSKCGQIQTSQCN